MRSALAFAALTLAAGCASSGLGQTVRDDITARMATTRDPIAACYHAALQREPALSGTMLVSFVAEAKTGKFTQVQITQTNIADPELQRCVTDQVAKLSLAEPQKADVAVSYPVRMTPSN